MTVFNMTSSFNIHFNWNKVAHIKKARNRCLLNKLRAFYAQLSGAKLYDYSLMVGGPLKRLRSPNKNQKMPITINMAIVT